MAETIGSLVDKLTIAELKLFHMREQIGRDDADPEHRRRCEERCTVLEAQRDDLAGELATTAALIADGALVPKVYRQFKMYNDPAYRTRSNG